MTRHLVFIAIFAMPLLGQNIPTENQVNHKIMLQNVLQHMKQIREINRKPVRKSNLTNDLIIGDDDPDEVVNIISDYYQNGNITIVNNGILNIRNTRFQLNGDVFIAGNGQLNVLNSNFTVIQEYIYEHDAIIIENGLISFTDVDFQSRGQSWSIGITGTARYILKDSEISDGFITTALLEESQVKITNTKTPGEFLCFNENSLVFKNCDFLLMWLVLPDESVIDMTLPEDTLITEWRLSGNEPGVEGIPYSVSIDSCTNVLWGLISITGSTATFRDTDFRVVGMMFMNPDSMTVSNLSNGTHYIDNILDVPDRILHLINTEVDTWNFYTSSKSNVTISNCVFGEILSQDSSKAFVMNSVCDGSGGYVGAFQSSQMIVYGSLIKSQVISRNSALLIGVHSAFQGSEVDADESSLMLIANTSSWVEPEAHDTAVLFEIQLPPLEGYTDDIIPVIGTARMFAGPNNPIQFAGYKIEYNHDPDHGSWQSTDGLHPDPVWNDTMAVWHTTGLDPGPYNLRGTVFHSYDDSIFIDSFARLDAQTWIERRKIQKSHSFHLYQNHPNPFNATTTIGFDLPRSGPVHISIFNSAGQWIQDIYHHIMNSGYHEVRWDACLISSGSYFIRIKTDARIKMKKCL